ncbi:VanZ family protein [Phenylobacterium sp. VNQ135]|uniref:VanZ family protein n=1 Tax=Phenylobacterium sp. VNQ135 TaxID=3400922 RepID=UPI003C0AE465
MLRVLAYALACAAVLYVCLAPTEALPTVSVWDKAEHALTWAALTGLGLLFWPRRPLRVAAFAFAFGAAIEALQGTMGLGRSADTVDLLADGLGVAAALGVFALLRRSRRGRA